MTSAQLQKQAQKQEEDSDILAQNSQQFKKYIQSNKQYLIIKFNHFFTNQETICKYSIQSVPQHNILNFLNGVFSLQNYNQNSFAKKVIEEALKSNIQQFKFQKMSQQKQKEVFDYERGEQLLIYVIENNKMFAVQYDSNQKNESKQNFQKSNLKIEVNLEQLQHNYQIEQKRNSSQEKLLFKMHQPNKNLALNNKLKSSFLQNQNQFDGNEQTLNDENINLVRKNAKIIFLFYCRQQMQLPNLSTFDYIKNQTQTMSLGKCLTFAKATQLYNVFIKKETLISKFRKLAQGKKTIDFQKFFLLLTHLQILDPQLNNRLRLNSQDAHKCLKYVKLPFNTKDTTPRQTIANRNFSNKLTQHSGKTSDNLKQQIQINKSVLKKICKIDFINTCSKQKNGNSQLITPNDLSEKYKRKKKTGKDFTIDLSFISSIIHPQETDHTWLKQHQISVLAKKNYKQTKFKRLETDRYQSVDKLTLRKQFIVDDIRKRIKQIESVQKISNKQKLGKIQLSLQNIKQKQNQKIQKSLIFNQNSRYSSQKY